MTKEHRIAARFDFLTVPKIVFGPGRLEEAEREVSSLGARPLVVTGRNIDRARPLVSLLENQGLRPAIYAVDREPDLDTVRLGVLVGREQNIDCVVGFGGGAALDTAKAIAAMAANPGDLLDYLEIVGRGKTLTEPALPLMAIPTTAGAGSEATRNAVVIAPEHRVKVSLRSPSLLPRVTLVDPELTITLPPGLTASTGLDALTQLIEAFVSTNANPVTSGICQEGIKLVARSLRQAVMQPQDLAARVDMSLASLLSGIALANAGLGAVHGLAGPLGGMISAPHAELCAALLPAVVETNLRALRLRLPSSPALSRYTTVAQLLTGDPAATADGAAHWLRSLVKELAIPGLEKQGLHPELIPELVEKAKAASSMQTNPVTLTAEELTSAVESAL